MAKSDDAHAPATMRLNKFLARAGFGSRRSVETLITGGQVSLNGKVIRDLGRQIDPDRDDVVVDGKHASVPRDYRIYVFHKPLSVVSTLKSQGGQASLLPYRLQADLADRFMPVGRLDSESTGLLLWTDDGQLNQDLCRPKTGLWKTYEVDIQADLPPNQIKMLTKGKIVIDGRNCLPCRLEPREGGTTRQWDMQLHEGRRRQIRRMFKAIDLKVIKLHRVAIGPVKLGLLRPGDFRRLTKREEEALREAIARSGKS